jgi:type II secretory pathway pseudopilin PulG
LVEVILAVAISAIVLVAIGGVFFSAVRLREKTSATLDAALPATQALAILRRDLQGTVGPYNVLAGDFKCGAQTMGVTMGLGSASGLGLDFFTSTGAINDNEPWGDIQEVYYQLKDSADRNQAGKDLVRYVNRNLLATSMPTPDEQWLMGNIDSVQFECYDGTQWRNTWDTSMGDTNLPTAVRVSIQLMAEPGVDARNLHPLGIVVPLVTQTLTTNSIGGAL